MIFFLPRARTFGSLPPKTQPLLETMQSFPIDHIVVDIDDTLTGNQPGVAQIDSRHLNGNVLFDLLRDCLVEAGSPSPAAEARLLDHVERHPFWDYSDIIEALALPSRTAWARLVAWHDRNLQVYEDGVQMVRRLHDAGFALSISSNNPLSGCLLKLHRAGLATLESSPWFSRIYASNVLMGQKSAPHWWPRLMEDLAVSPERALVVGDNPRDDMLMPRAAGFQHFVLVDRSQVEPCRIQDGVHYVSSLEAVPEILADLNGDPVEAPRFQPPPARQAKRKAMT